MDTWYIAGFYSGFANGPGYGSHIVRQPTVERDMPRCDEFGAHLMCRDIETFDALDITPTATSTVEEHPQEPQQHRSCRVQTLADFQEGVFLTFNFEYQFTFNNSPNKAIHLGHVLRRPHT